MKLTRKKYSGGSIKLHAGVLTMLDHPLIRALPSCIVCDDPKEAGNLVCWPCYRKHDMHYGNSAIETALDAIEARMVREKAHDIVS